MTSETGTSTTTYLTFILLLFLLPFGNPQPTLCIIGAGISGSSVAHFLRLYSDASLLDRSRILVFERNSIVGGRMATVTVAGDTFEAGASILHPQNYHALNFTNLLRLNIRKPPRSEDSSSFGIWDGKEFVLKTLQFDSKLPLVQKIVSLANSIYLFCRYGFSLLKMESFVEITVDKFLKFYEDLQVRPVFETVDEMLQWSGLYNLTTRSLQDELVDAKLSPLLIDELVTIITRINYGQSVSISGLAGAVSLAGSGGGLWSVEGGNWQMAAGLLSNSDVNLHLNEEIISVSYLGGFYELNSTAGSSYSCDVTVVATPLDEINIQFDPSISIPGRKLQHTHATFVRGLLNPVYFGLKSVTEIPELVGTVEDPAIPFSSISILKQHNETDITYKIFSRDSLADALLDTFFSYGCVLRRTGPSGNQETIDDFSENAVFCSARQETVRINWGAYPHYKAPEVFAPIVLDGKHLYYVNAFENAASTMETSAVAAENVARLILSRYLLNAALTTSSNLKSSSSDDKILHTDL